jgi:CRISPR-associated protein Cas1
MASPTPIASPRTGVLLLGGYGIRVAVERGHLCVEDGVGTNRRSTTFPRATRDLRRLVVLGHSGTVSFDALRWLSDVGAAFLQIDSDGRVLSAAGPTGQRDARLRRAQAQAVETVGGWRSRGTWCARS